MVSHRDPVEHADGLAGVPEHTTFPTGLGDEAISVVEYSGDRPRVVTSLRLENLLLTISYKVSGRR
ncbi:hypothetical protein ACFXPY_38970 [Streptomyces sp. NPDC059153]|uniref:hypothetical protein n=1 Tax=Streptomyces sp. NPDC059153 TaxID=3346743 RepID=UPI0036794597